ncbi:alpha/beta hydrolase [Burkholderia cenocepacia]|nr:alpha/beta hydrolase [Burkholderia cenocepacia]
MYKNKTGQRAGNKRSTCNIRRIGTHDRTRWPAAFGTWTALLRRIRGMVACFAALALAGCTNLSSPPSGSSLAGYYGPGTPELTIDHQSSDQPVLYPVLYGTNRKPVYGPSNKVPATYAGERDRKLHYGRVFVSIPKHHRIGSQGSWWGTMTGTDPFLRIERIDEMADRDAFLALARRALGSVTGPQDGYVVVYVHGYNNSFDDAAIRAAQLGADLDIPPNHMMLFSWPALHDVLKYTIDEATIDASEIFLRQFLIDVAAHVAQGRKIHLIAHSMGNRALLRVVDALATDPATSSIKFGQIILAAADVDRELFGTLGGSYVKSSDRTTVYLSPYDFAVGLSSNVVHDYPRVGCGDKPQVDVPGIANVVSTLPDDFPSHGYFGDTSLILADVKNLLLRNTPARSSAGWARFPTYWQVGNAPVASRVFCTTRNTLTISP